LKSKEYYCDLKKKSGNKKMFFVKPSQYSLQGAGGEAARPFYKNNFL